MLCTLLSLMLMTFKNAGKLNVIGVNISADTMHKVMANRVVDRDYNRLETLAISQTTGNRPDISDKVVATGDDWSDAFGGYEGQNDYGILSLAPKITKMDLTNLDTHNIKNMNYMLAGQNDGGGELSTLGNLKNWDTSNVREMQSLFQGETKITNLGDLSNWKTNNVINMDGMFSNTPELHYIGDIGKWNVSKVQGFDAMFSGTGLESPGDLSKWDTRSAENMESMFSGAENLRSIGLLDKWDVTNVGQLDQMFQDTPLLKGIGDLSTKTPVRREDGTSYKPWDTKKVRSMMSMFQNTGIEKLNISGWDFSSIPRDDEDGMIVQSPLSDFAAYNKDQVIIANGLKNIPEWWLDPEKHYNFATGLFQSSGGFDVVITDNPVLLKQETFTKVKDKSEDGYNSRFVFNGLRFFKQDSNAWVQESIPRDYIAEHHDHSQILFYMPTIYNSRDHGVVSNDAVAIVKKWIDKAEDIEENYLQNLPEYRNKEITFKVDEPDLWYKAPSVLEPVSWANAMILISTTNKEKKRANLLFEDDESGVTLSDWVTNTLNEGDQSISFGRQAQYILNHLRKQGYEVVAVTEDTDPSVEQWASFNGHHLDSTNPDRNNPYKWKFATHTDDPATRIFTVHLIHQKKTVSATKMITETIHYVYDDGTTAAPDYTATVSFDRTGTKDLVTGKTLWGAWTPASQTFPLVVSPIVDGLTGDPAEIAAQIVHYGDENLIFTVVYHKTTTPPDEKPNNKPGNKPGKKPGNKPDKKPDKTPAKKPNSKSDQKTANQIKKSKHVAKRTSRLAIKQKQARKQVSQQLPQTGDLSLSLVGMILLGLGLSLHIMSRKHRQF